MIALTQEKREALIGNYTKYIEWCNERLSSYLNDFDRGAIESSKLTTEIALASLTEGIAGHIFRDGNQFYHHPSSTMNMAIAQGEYAIAMYTAPPVPEIKLPSEKPSYGSGISEYDSGYNDGCYDTIEEIKRLNGLGE